MFATIALIIMILIWLAYLTIIQLISSPQRDPESDLPVPPRALTGNGAWPVFGHTFFFHKFGSEMAYLFPPEWREWRCLPWSRKLGDIYCVFLWGQWTVTVKGPERVKKVMLEGGVTEAWPYASPPVTLLGESCLSVLDEEEASCLRGMISGPLSHSSVVKHAPQFAILAKQCIEQIQAGEFRGDKTSQRPGKEGDEDMIQTSDSNSSDPGEKPQTFNIDALRSYTLDLMDGPVLNLNWSGRNSLPVQSESEDGGEKAVRCGSAKEKGEEKPNPDMLLLWMDRLKEGLCAFRLTFGPSWMQIWRMNCYGRALNARKHLVGLLGRHVEEQSELIPVHHEKGKATVDPFTSTLPLLKMTENYFFPNVHPVMGVRTNRQSEHANRERTQSESDMPAPDAKDEETNMLAALPRHRAQSEPDVLQADNANSTGVPVARKKQTSVLDQILGEADFEGVGITKMATTEMALHLWMMMDAGHAWTAMALSLLSKHEDTCCEVQAEIDHLEQKYKDRLFTSFVLGKMEKLDNLIYEAMRFCPAFVGGLKTMNNTIELDGVQIPKNTAVYLANPVDDESFTLDYPSPKKPEDVGMLYPNTDFYGFLPLQGLEIPIMVLQTKVFLIVMLQNHSPLWSGKRMNFMKRVTEQIGKSFRHARTTPLGEVTVLGIRQTQSNDSMDDRMEKGLASGASTPTNVTVPDTPQSNTPADRGMRIRNEDRLFTPVPFPEPRRPFQIVPRSDGEFCCRRVGRPGSNSGRVSRTPL